MIQRGEGFITADYQEVLGTSVRVCECLPANHLARLVVDVIGQLDLSRIYTQHASRGGVAYAPRILLGLLFYSYVNGVFNSQKIEQATYESIPFLYVSGGLHPDHMSIARFRRSFLPEIQELFVQTLVFARTAGVIKLGNISLDGFKVYGNSSNGKAVSYKRLLELKKQLREQVKELLLRAENADQGQMALELVVENEATFNADPLTSLLEARAALEACVKGHQETERNKRRASVSEKTPLPDRKSGGHASHPIPSRPHTRGRYNSADNGSRTADSSNGHREGGSEKRKKNGSNGRYKYSCRTCAIRKRCIDAKAIGPGLKLAITHMFENNTDTLETWAKLQQDCLLEQQERLQAGSDATRMTGLSWRLRQMRQSPEETLRPEPKPAVPVVRSTPAVPAPAVAEYIAPSSNGEAFGITCLDTERMVRLPYQGQVVLGRFEGGFSNPPDVDLAYDDGMVPSVSRRHARISSRGGKHWIEDLGSTNGTYLNGYQLALGETAQLNPGDRVLLGRCRTVFNPMPDWAMKLNQSVPHTPVLVITHTGQTIELPRESDIVLGRSDPSIAFTPDVDLGLAGDIGMVVSRRHARIIARDGQHFVAGAGSATGLRVNGRSIQLSDPPLLLQPGDQLWLGGCVVAYEWRLLEASN